VTARWQVETTQQFDQDFKKLDSAVQKRVMAYLEDLEARDDPRQRGRGLTANHSGIWRFRVGNYRILAEIVHDTLTVIALSVDHRKNAY
jgi:mRNA interferase RelE/StbE